ncbi:MAG TPA: hypothetical protein DCX14_08365 [Flavobacteriales bacterium]|nr:hypothetical protein [Flavobacteriales bacterium]
MDNKIELLVLFRAAMVMMNSYLDLMGSALILEDATNLYGKSAVQNLILDLADINENSSKDIKAIKAELIFAFLGKPNPLEERN